MLDILFRSEPLRTSAPFWCLRLSNGPSLLGSDIFEHWVLFRYGDLRTPSLFSLRRTAITGSFYVRTCANTWSLLGMDFGNHSLLFMSEDVQLDPPFFVLKIRNQTLPFWCRALTNGGSLFTANFGERWVLFSPEHRQCRPPFYWQTFANTGSLFLPISPSSPMTHIIVKEVPLVAADYC